MDNTDDLTEYQPEISKDPWKDLLTLFIDSVCNYKVDQKLKEERNEPSVIDVELEKIEKRLTELEIITAKQKTEQRLRKQHKIKLKRVVKEDDSTTGNAS